MDSELGISEVCEENFDVINATLKSIKIWYIPFYLLAEVL